MRDTITSASGLALGTMGSEVRARCTQTFYCKTTHPGRLVVNMANCTNSHTGRTHQPCCQVVGTIAM